MDMIEKKRLADIFMFPHRTWVLWIISVFIEVWYETNPYYFNSLPHLAGPRRVTGSSFADCGSKQAMSRSARRPTIMASVAPKGTWNSNQDPECLCRTPLLTDF